MIRINLFVGSRFPVDRKMIRERAKDVLLDRGLDNIELDISIVGSRKIKELNESKLAHEGTTDVLSFPQHEKNQLHDFPLPEGVPPHLGDIVISFPEAVKTAKKFGKRVDHQICFYLEHGLMHLLGYHHD